MSLISNSYSPQIQSNYTAPSSYGKSNAVPTADNASTGGVEDKVDLSAAALKLITGTQNETKVGSTTSKLQTDALTKVLQDKINTGNDIIKSLDAGIVDVSSTAGSADVGANLDIVV